MSTTNVDKALIDGIQGRASTLDRLEAILTADSGTCDPTERADDLRDVSTTRRKFVSRSVFGGLSEESQKALVSSVVQRKTGWQLGVRGSSCWRSWFGVYVGIPGSYTVNSDLVAGTGVVTAIEYDPMYSVSVTFSPLSGIRLMAGLTRSNALDSESRNVKDLAWTFGIGGNLDLAASLLGK